MTLDEAKLLFLENNISFEQQEYANEITARKDMATEGLLDYTNVSGELFSGV